METKTEQKDVIIYSTNTCSICDIAKEFFKAHDVKYTEYNVGEDSDKRAEMMEKSGQMGVPVIQIENDIVVGFEQALISDLLNIK